MMKKNSTPMEWTLVKGQCKIIRCSLGFQEGYLRRSSFQHLFSHFHLRSKMSSFHSNESDVSSSNSDHSTCTSSVMRRYWRI
jgi:hypothetical protein